MSKFRPFSTTGHPKATIDRRLQIVAQRYMRWWGEFNLDWRNCERCPLHKTRHKVSFFRGLIPAHILFIGEAPGQEEDERGIPFVGPAGRKLDALLTAAGCEDGMFCIINSVGCLPPETNEMGMQTGRVRSPEKPEIKACRPRTDDLINHINPRLICLLGRVAASVKLPEGIPVVKLTHPAAMLRAENDNSSRSILEERRFILTLRTKILEMGLGVQT